MWKERMKKFYKGKKIKGRNLSEVNADFSGLCTVLPVQQKSHSDTLQKFEDVMVDIFETCSDLEIENLQIKDGKVVIENGALFHVLPLNLESLEGISVGGLLCSEWFGTLESEHEGRFCAFLNAKPNAFDTPKVDNTFTLVFDTNHPLTKKLVQNDYFEYIKRKKDLRKALFDNLSEEEKEDFYKRAKEAYRQELMKRSFVASKGEAEINRRVEKLLPAKYIDKYPLLLPEKLNIKLRNLLKEKYNYDDLILDLFDQIIEPLSQASTNFHDNPQSQSYHWRAIPGGLPSSLINGIQINAASKDMISQKDIQRIQRMFPKAVIFDENRKVLSRPQKQGR